jgi:hypothetical protein
MNTLIEELAEHSGMTQYVAANNKFLEDFAKRIMHECATACSHPCCGRDETAENLINDHFGV